MAQTMERRLFSIGIVSQLTGVPTATLRDWEAQGVVNPARVEGQDCRLYDMGDVELIRRHLETRPARKRTAHTMDAGFVASRPVVAQ